MKKVKKSDTYEPTAKEVMSAVLDLTVAVQDGFARTESVLAKHEKLINVIIEGQDTLAERVNDIDRRLINTQNRVEDIAEQLESVDIRAQKNEQGFVGHERRILRLEKAGARA